AVQVPPFPVAMFGRRRFQGAPGGIAVLELQGGGGGGDVRAVVLPALVGGEGAKAHGGEAGYGGDDDEAKGQDRRQGRPGGGAAAAEPLGRGSPPRLDRLVVEEALQVLGQFGGRRVAAGGVAVDGLVDNRHQVAGDGAVEPVQAGRLGGGHLADQPVAVGLVV